MKRGSMVLAGLFFIVVIGLLTYVRFAPHNIEHWHQDPETVKSTGRPNDYRLAGDASVNINLKQAKISQMIMDYAGQQERIELLANTDDGQLLTFIQRSKLIAYPDYLTIKIEPNGDRSKLSFFSRSRFGYRDFGVNKLRINSWVDGIRGLTAGR